METTDQEALPPHLLLVLSSWPPTPTVPLITTPPLVSLPTPHLEQEMN